jgi:hypothetical protein
MLFVILLAVSLLSAIASESLKYNNEVGGEPLIYFFDSSLRLVPPVLSLENQGSHWDDKSLEIYPKKSPTFSTATTKIYLLKLPASIG